MQATRVSVGRRAAAVTGQWRRARESVGRRRRRRRWKRGGAGGRRAAADRCQASRGCGRRRGEARERKKRDRAVRRARGPQPAHRGGSGSNGQSGEQAGRALGAAKPAGARNLTRRQVPDGGGERAQAAACCVDQQAAGRGAGPEPTSKSRDGGGLGRPARPIRCRLALGFKLCERRAEMLSRPPTAAAAKRTDDVDGGLPAQAGLG